MSDDEAGPAAAARDTVGSGRGVAVLFNGRAKQVTPSVVHAMQKALPDALVLVSEDLEQAQRHVELIAQAGPQVVLSGGGDGAAMRLLNLLRALGPAGAPLPRLGVLRLGTGNAWARVVGAQPYARTVHRLRQMPWPLPTQRFDLVEVERTVCPFTGVGWDARVLNDYQRNLDRRSGQLFGSRLMARLHKGLGGYLYSVARHSVPQELAAMLQDPPRVRVLRLGGEAFRLEPSGEPVRVEGDLLYEGPVSVGAAATCPEYGYGFRAFPFARAMPGFINVRVYDRPVTEAVLNAARLWSGAHPIPGMHDLFVKRARLDFTRPMPFQIGGDAHGERGVLEVAVAQGSVDIVDWRAAGPAAPGR